MSKLSNSEKKELKVLQTMCLDSKGAPKQNAAEKDLKRMSVLLEKAEDKPTQKKQAVPTSVNPDDVAATYTSQGYEYLGTDGKQWYFYKGGYAYKTGSKMITGNGLEMVGHRFAPEFLATLTK